MGVRVEVATAGIDDAFQGLSTDPYQAPVSQGTGLRIPQLRVDNQTRYVFLLATRTIGKPTRVRGIRQYATLGATLTNGVEDELTSQPIEFPIVTPNFYLTDGNISWHLVEEPNADPIRSEGTNNSTCFSEANARSPALLFLKGSVAWGMGPQPLYYFNGMTAYAPPAIWNDWQPIGGLGNMHDVRFPWESQRAWTGLDIPICARGERRVSLYASVLQTAGAVPLTGNESFPAGGRGYGPEQDFIDAMSVLANVSSVFFWKVAGAIIFEDDE